MEENKSLEPGNNRFLTPEQIKAQIGIMLTKKHGNHQAALNQLKTAVVTPETLSECQQALRNLNGFLSSIEALRKEIKQPSLDYGKSIDGTFKEYCEPFEKEKIAFQAKVNKVAQEEAARIAKENAEKQRQAAITGLINQFILDKSVEIAAATTNEQLLSLERLINLEKANKSKYDTQLPSLIERCNELNEKIKAQKELVKKREELEQQKKEAEKLGDDEKLIELEQKTAEIDDKIADNTINVQEIASNNIILTGNVEDTLSDAPKARRTVWKAEINDEKEVLKKAKDMLDISLNPEKVRTAIATLKAAGTFEGKQEVVINGIRYFEEKTF